MYDAENARVNHEIDFFARSRSLVTLLHLVQVRKGKLEKKNILLDHNERAMINA